MSINSISSSNPLGFGKSKTVSVSNLANQDPSVFASLLSDASKVERVDGVKAHGTPELGASNSANSARVNTSGSAIENGGAVFGNNAAEFAHMLAEARGYKNTNISSNGVVNTNQTFGLADLYNNEADLVRDLAASESADSITSLNSLLGLEHNAEIQRPSYDPNQVVTLEDKQLDFSSLLPSGTRDFVQSLKLPQSDINSFVNLMVFGRENGPHGLSASDYFGTDSLSAGDLASRVENLVSSAQINAPALNGDDFNFVLKGQGSDVSIAQEQGQNLDNRVFERELDSTFRQDMALMQILARSNDQSASIF